MRYLLIWIIFIFYFAEQYHVQCAAPVTTAPSFNFGGSTASAPVSSGAVPKFGGFNFPSAPAVPVNTPVANSGFSFGGVSSDSKPAAPAAAAANGGGEDDDEEIPEEPPTVVEALVNTEETAIYEVKSKIYKFNSEEKQWKDRATGICRLLKHNTSGLMRIVARNSVGKVALNIGIGKTFEFIKISGKGGGVRFIAKNEDEVGSWMIRVKAEHLDAFYDKCESMKK